MEQDGVHSLLPWGGRWLGVGADTVEFGGESPGIGTEGVQPIDDETPKPGIGTVPKQRPDLLSFAQANQGNRRPCLPLGKSVLDLLRDGGTVPDRGGDQRSFWSSTGHRPRQRAITLVNQFPASLQ